MPRKQSGEFLSGPMTDGHKLRALVYLTTNSCSDFLVRR
jgi:hypothetical protein